MVDVSNQVAVKKKLSLKKKLIIIISSVLAGILVIYVSLFYNLHGRISWITYYNGDSNIEKISLGEHRAAFICENGDCYLSGTCGDALFFTNGTGLNIGWWQFPMVNFTTPKLIFKNVAQICLSGHEGAIVDNDNKLYYFNMTNYRTPTYVRSDIVCAYASVYLIYAVTTDGDWVCINIKHKSGNGTDLNNQNEETIMSGVISVYQNYALTNDGKLLLYNNGSISIVCEDVKCFSITANDKAIAVIKNNGDLYIKGEHRYLDLDDDMDNYDELTFFDSGVEDVCVIYSGMAIKYSDGRIRYIGKDNECIWLDINQYRMNSSFVDIVLYEGKDCQISCGEYFVGVLDKSCNKIMYWGANYHQAISSSYRDRFIPFSGDPYVMSIGEKNSD